MKLDLAKRLVNARTEKNLTQEKLSDYPVYLSVRSAVLKTEDIPQL